MRQISGNDLIALADQDDIWLPRKLEILEKNIDDADLVFGDAEIINADGAKIADSWRIIGKIQPHLSTKALITGFTDVTGCLSLFKAALLTSVLPIPEGVPVHDQWITFCASLHNGYKSIPDKILQYRIHDGNSIGLGNSYSWSDRLNINLKWVRAIIHCPIFQLLSPAETSFAFEYEKYLSRRFLKSFQITAIPWAWKNRHDLYPHCKTLKDFICRSLIASIGVKPAQIIFKKK